MEKDRTIYDIFKEKIGVKKQLDIKKRELAITTLISTAKDRDLMREKIVLPLIIEMFRALVHFNYENFLNLKNVSKKEIQNFLEKRRINPPSLYTYNNVQKDSLFLLVLFAALEQENISINNQNIDIIVKLLSGENLTIQEITVLGISDGFNLNLLKKIKRNNFEYTQLTDIEQTVINNYHLNYMQREILPLISNYKITKQEILNRTEDIIIRR